MILCPIQNTAVLKQGWTQVRPVVTQEFGSRPEFYKKLTGGKLKAHEGTDLRAKTGTQIFAPIDGYVQVRDSGDVGYGKHVAIRNPFKALEIKIAHLSEFQVVDGQTVQMGDKIALSGNTGSSSADHLHICGRLLKPTGEDVWKWPILNAKNGYQGYFDLKDKMICWKGSLTKNSL